MREIHKPIAKIGHFRGVGYRNNLLSVCSDLEAMVDAYGAAAICEYARMIESDLHIFGDSINNGIYNQQLNQLPYPAVRKQNKTKASRKKNR